MERKLFFHRLRRVLVWVALAAFTVIAGFAVWLVFDPADAIASTANFFLRGTRLSVRSAQWDAARGLVAGEIEAAPFFKARRMELRWTWRGLWRRHLAELRVEGLELLVDNSWIEGSGGGPASRPRDVWFLDRLVLGNATQIAFHLAPGLPPLFVDMEGGATGVPLGWGCFSSEELTAARRFEIRRLRINSSVDPTHTILHIEDVRLDYRIEGLLRRELDLLVFRHPTLDVDRSLFWFVEELRKAHAARPAPPPDGGPRWRTRLFRIEGGKLDITRLQQIALKYPLEFEVSRENLELENLSLLALQLEMHIPNQDIRWESHGLVFKNLRGKVIFNLSRAGASPLSPGASPANDLVNTITVDSIQWRDLLLENPWLSLTFDPRTISGHFGGATLGGYLGGGVSCGWSVEEPWNFWGAATKLDTRRLGEALANESVEMKGLADMGFTLDGKGPELTGTLKLASDDKGSITIRTLDNLLERIREKTEGVRREALQALVRGMREYPYDHYTLNIAYHRPSAELHFRSDGPVGQRKLDLRWHGNENPP